MFFLADLGSRVKPSGQGKCICPACQKAVVCNAIKKHSVIRLFFVPVLSFGNSYLLTCPSCASVLGLDKQKGRQLESGSDIPIFPADLVLLQNNAGNCCTTCGAHISASHNFCPNCGQKT